MLTSVATVTISMSTSVARVTGAANASVFSAWTVTYSHTTLYIRVPAAPCHAARSRYRHDNGTTRPSYQDTINLLLCKLVFGPRPFGHDHVTLPTGEAIALMVLGSGAEKWSGVYFTENNVYNNIL